MVAGGDAVGSRHVTLAERETALTERETAQTSFTRRPDLAWRPQAAEWVTLGGGPLAAEDAGQRRAHCGRQRSNSAVLGFVCAAPES